MVDKTWKKASIIMKKKILIILGNRKNGIFISIQEKKMVVSDPLN